MEQERLAAKWDESERLEGERLKRFKQERLVANQAELKRIEREQLKRLEQERLATEADSAAERATWISLKERRRQGWRRRPTKWQLPQLPRR